MGHMLQQDPELGSASKGKGHLQIKGPSVAFLLPTDTKD